MRRRVPLAAMVGVGILLLAGCSGAPDAAAPRESATVTPAPTPVVGVPVTAATPVAVRPAVPPVRLLAASIEVDMPVVPVGVAPEGFMELPVDPAVGGWYRFGSDPDAGEGAVVIAAHVDAPDYPIGPLSRVRDLAAGAEVDVVDSSGAVHGYVVQTVTYYAKTELPVDALFTREGTGMLVLITCGGEYDAASGHYTDNVVAVATPAG
jgi:hypothetical protein